MNLTSLLGDRHVFVDYTDAALAGNGNGKLRLGDSVHGCGNQRHVEADAF